MVSQENITSCFNFIPRVKFTADDKHQCVLTTLTSFPFTCRLLFIITTRTSVDSHQLYPRNLFWAVFNCSFFILRISQLGSDVCLLPFVVNMTLRASSHEPGFRDLALPLYIPCKIFDLFIWDGGLARFPRSRFSVSGLKILPYEHFSPVTGMKAGWILAARMASSCTAYCVFHLISIPFNCIDTALRVVKAMVGPKVRIFVFIRICFIYRISSQNSFRGSLTFFHHGNRAKISHMNPKRSWSQ